MSQTIYPASKSRRGIVASGRASPTSVNALTPIGNSYSNSERIFLASIPRVSPIMETTLHSDGLVQDYSNSIANALELLQSCTKPYARSGRPFTAFAHFDISEPILSNPFEIVTR